MTPPLTAPPRRTATRSLATTALAGTLAALVGTSLVFAGARLADLELVVSPPGQSTGPVPHAAVVGAVVVAGAAAFVGAVVLGRLRHGRRWFLALTTAVLLVSFASPVGAAEETSTAVVLSTLHVVVAAALVPALAARMSGERR